MFTYQGNHLHVVRKRLGFISVARCHTLEDLDGKYPACLNLRHKLGQSRRQRDNAFCEP
jgi:hypothetical protein